MVRSSGVQILGIIIVIKTNSFDLGAKTAKNEYLTLGIFSKKLGAQPKI